MPIIKDENPEAWNAALRKAAATRSAALPPPSERRRLREEGGLTVQDVADGIGAHASSVRSWESGKDPRAHHLQKRYAAFLAELGAAIDARKAMESH